METKEILKRICEAPYEHTFDSKTHKTIEEIISPFCEKIETDALGNLICHITEEGEKSIVLSAHMDKIGMVVTGIDKATGMLKIDKAGGIDLRTLAAARVKVIGSKVLFGCISSTPPHLTSGDRNKVSSIDSLFVDCGLSYDEIIKYVSLGDTVEYHSPITELLGGRLTGAYMDNSAGCAAVIKAAQMLKNAGTKNKVTAVFTTREEIGKQGATAVFTRLQPDLALITDVSFACAPGIPKESSSPLLSGAMICISPILQKEVALKLIEEAEKNAVPYTVEVMGSRTATDSDVAVNAGTGIKTGLVSIPLLNMHTPVETLDIKDVDAVAQLLFNASKGG
ncbi:MAG: M20/M25/M40 family metallo-hydrolase [Clostridia bacterium]|nr:M20/M25/M40 family metallo-hydrolase [Clostridia bacterium]